MVDALDLGSSTERRVGSSPTIRTRGEKQLDSCINKLRYRYESAVDAHATVGLLWAFNSVGRVLALQA